MRTLSPRNTLWLLIASIAATVNLLLPSTELFAVSLIVLGILTACHTPLAMLVLLLVLSPLRTLIVTESSWPLPLDIGQILLIVYLSFWLATRITTRRPILALRRDNVLVAILGLCCVLSIGVWTSASLSAWLREWLKWMTMAVFVWHLALAAAVNWRWLVFALLVAAFANAVVGLYIFFGGSGADHLVILGRFFRAFGTFGQPNPFGGFMGIALPLSIMGAYGQLNLLVSRYRAEKKLHGANLVALVCLAVCSAFISAALVASWSRGAWLGFAFALAVMLFAIPERISRGLGYAIGLGLLLGGLWITGLVPQSIVTRLTRAAGEFFTIEDIRGVDISPVNYAVMERVAHWQAALNMAEANPVFGVGLGNYEVVYDDYRLINWMEPMGHAHNFYLNMLAESGIFGLTAFLVFWIAIFVITWQARAHPDPFARSIVIGLLGCWTYLAIHSVFDNLYVNNLFLHIGVLFSILSVLSGHVNRALVLE